RPVAAGGRARAGADDGEDAPAVALPHPRQRHRAGQPAVDGGDPDIVPGRAGGAAARTAATPARRPGRGARRLVTWGAPKWPLKPPNARGAPAKPWHPSILDRLLVSRAESRSAIRPGLRDLQLRREPEQRRLVAEAGDELH